MDEFQEVEFDLSLPIDEITNSDHRLRAIDKFAPKYEVEMAKDKTYKGFKGGINYSINTSAPRKNHVIWQPPSRGRVATNLPPNVVTNRKTDQSAIP